MNFQRNLAAVALFASLTCGSNAVAAPVIYQIDVNYDATDFFCVGCGGTNMIYPDYGGTLAGTVTIDDDLTAASRIVAYDLVGFLPQEPQDFIYGPRRSFNFNYVSTAPTVSVSNLVGDVFAFTSLTELDGDNLGWNSSLVMNVTGGLTDGSLAASFEETVHFQSVAGFDIYSRQILRNDRRARNMNTPTTLTEATAVPLPAGAPLVLAGIGAFAALRRRKTGSRSA